MALRFNPPGVWSPRGRGFNMGVAHHAGFVMHFTGQVAWDENEQIVGEDDVEAQTRQCFLNIVAMLETVGGELDDIVSLTTYFTTREQLPLIQKVCSEFLQPETAPASTSVMVAGLSDPAFLVEITPVALIPVERFVVPTQSGLSAVDPGKRD